MAFRKIKITGILFTILINSPPAFAQDTLTSTKYEFDFSSSWNWEDLIDKAAIIDPYLIKSIDNLRKKISIEDARIIFNQLSKLDSLQELSKLSNFIHYESIEDRAKKDLLAGKWLDSMIFKDGFGGLISAALPLAEIKVAKNKGLFEFNSRNYLPQPTRISSKNFKINFNFSIAERILKYYDADSISNKTIFDTGFYQLYFNENNLHQISPEKLNYFLIESARDNALSSIYKWINPESFGNLGGVSVYRDNFGDVLKGIKNNEGNIKLAIEKNISEYLPDSIQFEVNVIFLLGKKGLINENEKKDLLVNLEYFGDNYDYLIKYIIHEIFKIVQKEIQLPVDELVTGYNDRKLIKLLSNVFENGTANYIGPVGEETRPWYLLEKDFKLFNNTLRYLSTKDYYKADSLINIGYSGDAPFYTMATQIAYIIETTLGRNALIDAIRCGPVIFFNKYIEAYSEFPDKIRNVFTFKKSFEDKIGGLLILYPEHILKEALELKKFRSNESLFKEQVQKFITKNEDPLHSGLIYLLSGQLLLETEAFEEAKNLFLKGIIDRKDKGYLSGEIGKEFFKRDALDCAVELFNYYTKVSPNDANSYVLRGEYFYETGQYEKARVDFERAVSLDSNLRLVKSYLMKINNN